MLPNISRRAADTLPLIVVLPVQACLLFYRLSLLPVWTDELFTVQTVSRPVREIIAIVQQDIHPPLYFLLLSRWIKLPLPWDGEAALRSFSVVWAVLATFLLDRFWTRRLQPLERWLALGLFAFSPCLLLYGRMARSYSMQAALALLAIGLFHRWMEEPRSIALGCGAVAAELALLYTHYVPGVALLTGFAVAGWGMLGSARIGAYGLAVCAGYAPWALTLMGALGRWRNAGGFSSNYTVSGNVLLEQGIKIGFGVVSLTVGESFFAFSLVLVPVMILLAFSGTRTARFPVRLTVSIGVAAIVGYLGVARWVSYPFIPARLLWLLPMLSLAMALGISCLKDNRTRFAVVLLVSVSFVSSHLLYFRKENYLNLGYAAPLREIAAELNHEAQPGDLILLDEYDTDYQVITALLSGNTPVVTINPASASEARRRSHSAKTVWIVRNTRDVSPEHVTTAVQSESCAGRVEATTLLEPYAAWQQAVMRVVGMRPLLTHFYQLTTCVAVTP